MNLIMGVDGGQTSLKCALARPDGTILSQGLGRGITHLAVQGAQETFQAALKEAAAQAWAAAGLEPRPLAALALGLTGISAPDTPEARLAAGLANQSIAAQRTIVENDAMIALKGAHAGQPGIIVISGTGTIAYGQDNHGKIGRASGWGWLLGDEGSAYWIGREGIRAALRAQEKAGPPTALLEIFQRHFGIEDMIEIKRTVFAPDFGSKGFAALAPLVAQACAGEDTVARGILEQGGRELAALAEAVARQLDFSQPPVPVAPIGGAFEHFEVLRQSFAVSLNASPISLQSTSPRHSALVGAVILAREMSKSQSKG